MATISSFEFQPTLPARGATGRRCFAFPRVYAFQPTLPARGATRASMANLDLKAFQPTLPARGATTLTTIVTSKQNIFQPTLPARGATWRCWLRQPTPGISTHTPRTGSDVSTATSSCRSG